VVGWLGGCRGGLADRAMGDAGEDHAERITPLRPEEQATEQVPAGDRSCTDVLWLVLLGLYVGGMVGLTALALEDGDPNRLLFGANHEGELCGGETFPDQKYLAFPRATEDLLMSGFFQDQGQLPSFFGVCVPECPLAGDYVCTQAGENAVATLVAQGDARDTVINSCIEGWFTTLPFGSSCKDPVIHSNCFANQIDTVSVFFRCLPQYTYEVETLPESGCIRTKSILLQNGTVQEICTVFREVTKVTREQPTASNVLFDSFNTFSLKVQTLIGDVMKARTPIFVSGVGGSLLFGFFYVVSLWCCVGVVVWVTVIAAVLFSFLFTLLCYIKSGQITTSMLSGAFNSFSSFIEDTSNSLSNSANGLLEIINGGSNGTLNTIDLDEFEEKNLPDSLRQSQDFVEEFTYVAYFMTVFTIVLILVVIGLKSRISRAIEIFGEASLAIRQNVLLLVIPFVSMGFSVAAIAAWAVATAFVASAGTFNLKTFNQTISLDPSETVYEINEFGSWDYGDLLVVYMFFGLLWILSFMDAVFFLGTSGVILSWFWIKQAEDIKSRAQTTTIFKSFGTAVRYHLGTAAFGGLVLAFMQFIRYLAAYIQRKIKSASEESRVMKYLFCWIHCLLACLQRVVNFVSRNAFIYCAMYGSGFCSSAIGATMTISSNLTQVALVTFLGDIITRFGQLLISLSAAVACFVLIELDDDFQFGGSQQLSSTITPIFATAVLAWFISAEVLGIYDITVATILLSYCQDNKLQKFKPGHQLHPHTSLDQFFERHAVTDSKQIKDLDVSIIN